MTGAKPAYFGLGFIQLKLNETERLHYWHEDFPEVVAEEDIHDHRYDFESTVLAGSLWHETWSFLQSSHGPHQMWEVSCSPDSAHDPKLLDYGFADLTARYVLTRDSSYTIRANEFHRGGPKGRAVTLVHRGPVEKVYARVIRPTGAPHICPFSNGLGSEDFLWTLIHRVIHDLPLDLP